jgi:predicted NAD/FAD-binding protein
MIATWPELASPRLAAGAVLLVIVWHLARGAHSRLIAALQRRVAHKLGGGGWTNLGAPGAPSYEAACAALAEAVCSTEKVDGPILSVGCGSSGKELAWLAERYDTSVMGVDAAAAVKTFADPRIRLLRGRADDLRCGSRCHGLVVAIDCAYHFHLDAFLSEAFKTLKPGGLLRFSHVCGSVVGLGLLGVRTVPSVEALQRALSVNGFEDIDVRTLPNVLERWNLAFGGRLTYVIVSARRPESDKPRPRVAVIGGGLSGLTSAFRLRRAGCAVTLFERAPSLGLSRNEWRGPHGVVDVPLRMVGEGYYLSLLNLCRDASVCTTRATVDCSFTLGSGAVVAYSRSKLGNLLQLRRIGLWNALRLDRALKASYDGSWGAFLSRHRLDHTNPAAAILNAQLSWVLSASSTAVAGTPAGSILDYARGLALSLKTCLVGSRNFVSRVTPSIGALERALAFGCDIRLGRAVIVEGDRCIDGVAYDSIIVATPPSCTRAVLPSLIDGEVFDQFATETRSLIIHRDASLMPSDRRDWRSLNVTCAADGEAASLTVWLNAFYPELEFEGDIFETWAPRTAPSHVIREVALPRVVQTVDQHKLHAGIAALQGRNGIYFAGAHVVPGMGLLEQACAAGDAAALSVVRSLQGAGFEC